MGSFGDIQAVIYCRVSSSKQVREGHGLEGQEKRCYDYAVSKGYSVVDVFREEGISGAVTNRPAMRRLLEFLEENHESIVVIIDDIKRLARNVEGHFELRAEICSRKGVIESPSHKFEETPIGKFVESIFASAAEFERNENKVQVRNRMQARLELGFWTFNNPVGYKYSDTAPQGKILIPDEPSATVIQKAFVKFATNELLTQASVRDFLLRNGLMNSKGHTMNVWLEGVKRILKNPIYAGYIEYPEWGVSRRIGQHEPLVSKEIFEDVNKKLLNKRKVFRTGIEHDFPLRGFILCSGCGRLMTGSWSKGRNRKFPYYRCSNSNSCSVKPKSVGKDAVESNFLDFLNTVNLDSRIVKLATRITEEVYKKKFLEHAAAVSEERSKLENIHAEIKKHIEKVISCTSPAVIAGIEAKVEELMAEAKGLELIIERGKGLPANLHESLQRVMDFIEKPSRYWVEGGLRQKHLVQSLLFVDAIEYSKESGFGTANFSLPFRLLKETSGSNSNLVETAGVEPASVSPLPSALHA